MAGAAATDRTENIIPWHSCSHIRCFANKLCSDRCLQNKHLWFYSFQGIASEPRFFNANRSLRQDCLSFSLISSLLLDRPPAGTFQPPADQQLNPNAQVQRPEAALLQERSGARRHVTSESAYEAQRPGNNRVVGAVFHILLLGPNVDQTNLKSSVDQKGCLSPNERAQLTSNRSEPLLLFGFYRNITSPS